MFNYKVHRKASGRLSTFFLLHNNEILRFNNDLKYKQKYEQKYEPRKIFANTL